jgi:hypothetical protein
MVSLMLSVVDYWRERVRRSQRQQTVLHSNYPSHTVFDVSPMILIQGTALEVRGSTEADRAPSVGEPLYKNLNIFCNFIYIPYLRVNTMLTLYIFNFFIARSVPILNNHSFIYKV